MENKKTLKNATKIKKRNFFYIYEKKDNSMPVSDTQVIRPYSLVWFHAVLAMSAVGQGDYERAHRLGRYSVWVSTVGLLASLTAFLIYLLVTFVYLFGG